MPEPSLSHCQADALANNLYANLSEGSIPTLPSVDLTSAEYDIPDTSGNPLYGTINRLEEVDLTDRTIGGSGLFDGLMAALNGHLKQEYEKGRITGKEYSETYIALTTAAMSNAVSFLTSRDTAYWSAIAAQQQARLAEIETVRARLEKAITAAKLVTAYADTDKSIADAVLAKMRLATEDANYCLTKAQGEKVEYENANILPQELAQITKANTKLDFEISDILPKERDRIQSAIDATVADISRTTAEKDKTLYETSAILPAQKLNIDADKALKDYQLASVLPAQVAGMDADNVGKVYNNEFLLPAQLSSIKEQTEAHRAKTLDTRMDGVTVVTGAIGKQKELHQQQITSYQRDAEAKAVKMILDTWITQKSLDEGLAPPTSLTDTNIDAMMGHLRTNLNMT